MCYCYNCKVYKTSEFWKTKDKMQQVLLQHATAILLQNASGFFITKSDSYFKFRQIYYEMRQLLQKAKFISNCDSAIINPKSIYEKCHSREQITAFNWRSLCLSCSLMKNYDAIWQRATFITASKFRFHFQVIRFFSIYPSQKAITK